LSQRSKNHHFVPKVLQQRFAAEKNRIWYSTRGADGEFDPPESRNIEKTFRIRNYYTVLNDDEKSDIIEREFYGRIDNYLGKVLPDVLSAFERGEKPKFIGEPLDTIRRIVFEMAKRTPEFTKQIDEVSIGTEIVETALDALPADSKSIERSKLLADLEDSIRLRDYGRDVRVRATITTSKKIEQALGEFSVRWSVSDTHHSFILSSLMAYRIGNGASNGLSNPKMELWMPIAPKIALVLLRDKENQIPLTLPDSSAHIRQVNEFAMKNSKQIASHSRKLIESLTGKPAKQR
jgi:Protein of unknown function (DUF4238)